MKTVTVSHAAYGVRQCFLALQISLKVLAPFLRYKILEHLHFRNVTTKLRFTINLKQTSKVSLTNEYVFKDTYVNSTCRCLHVLFLTYVHVATVNQWPHRTGAATFSTPEFFHWKVCESEVFTHTCVQAYGGA